MKSSIDNIFGSTQNVLTKLKAIDPSIKTVAVNYINEISGKNQKDIEMLMYEVSRFKVVYGRLNS